MTKLHLNNPKDVKIYRDARHKRLGYDELTFKDIPIERAVLDHCHKTNLVRGILDRNVNSFLGRVENAFRRDMFTFDGTISDALRKTADYLEREINLNPYHPAWKKRCVTEWNKLNSKAQEHVLKSFGDTKKYKNGVERKNAFKKIIKSGNVQYQEFLDEMEHASLIHRSSK